MQLYASNCKQKYWSCEPILCKCYRSSICALPTEQENFFWVCAPLRKRPLPCPGLFQPQKPEPCIHLRRRWAFDELRSIAEMKFRFAEEEDACEYVTHLAADMRLYRPPHVLKGAYLYDDWDPELVKRLLDSMTPRAARLDVQTRAYDTLTAQIQKVRRWKLGRGKLLQLLPSPGKRNKTSVRC